MTLLYYNIHLSIQLAWKIDVLIKSNISDMFLQLIVKLYDEKSVHIKENKIALIDHHGNESHGAMEKLNNLTIAYYNPGQHIWPRFQNLRK